jgi:hypothetical protein
MFPTIGIGLTIILNDWDGPGQEIVLFVKIGVIVTFEIIGATELLMEIKGAMTPVPKAVNPVEV